MKNIWKYAILAAVLFTACARISDEPVSEDQYTYKIIVGGDTRAVFSEDHIAWEAGDKVGWFTDKEGSSQIDMSATPRSFTVSSNAALAAGSKIYAYAPFKASGQSKNNVTLSIPVAQDQTGAEYDADAMPLVAIPVEVKSAVAAGTDTPIGEAKFYNLGAMIRYDVFTSNSDYASETIKSVAFKASSAIAGSFRVDLTGVSAENAPAITGLSENEVVTSLSQAVGSSRNDATEVYQIIVPGTWSGTITVQTDKATYEYTAGNIEFPRSSLRPLVLDLASSNAVRTSTGGNPEIEALLTAHPWVLKGVKEEGGSVTTSVGNILTLNADYSMSFDCSANGGKTFDHTWAGGLIAPDEYGAVSSMEWCTWEEDGVSWLGVSSGYLMVFIQDNTDWGAYEIKELTESTLTVEIVTYDETWTILFEEEGTPVTPPEPGDIECPYWHTFADGDFGIGPAFDWGGWEDGYYFDMLTNPAVLDGAVWTISDAGYFEWAGTEGWRKGIQLGANSVQVSNFTLASSSFPGTITSVTLGYNAPGNVSGITVSCTVGGSSFGSPVTHGDGDYEAVFTGSASGEIIIRIDSPKKAPIYLYYLYIEFTPD